MRRTRRDSPRRFLPGTLAVRCILAGGLLCLVAGAGLWIAHPVTAKSPAENEAGSFDDLQLTVLAREALTQEPRLRALNLWVVVKDRVATLGGPIPSADLARLAEERLRPVAGLVKIVNNLQTEREEDAAVNAMPPRPRTDAPASGDRPRGSVLTATPRSNPHVTGKAPPEVEGLLALPTIRLTLPAQGPSAVSVARPPLPDPADLAQSIDRLRQADARFQLIQADVIDGAVFLRGSVPSGADQFELAEQISQLPGVTRVVLAEVRVEPGRSPRR